MQGALCKRCLLQDMPEQKYYQSVLEYLSALPAQSKCAQEEYQRRLAACRDCEELVGGACLQCGCFVEMRAAVAAKGCPALPSRW